MKNKTRKCFLTIMLAIVMLAMFMPASVLAEDGAGSVTSHADFVAAIENSEVTTINVTGDFPLTEDVTIEREVTITCLSDPGYTITTGDYSIIMTGPEAVVTVSGNLTVTGQEPIQVTDLGTVDISSGTIEATGDGSSGVYVLSDGIANISGGTITATGAYSAGVWVEVGTATVSGGTITAAGDDSAAVLVRPYSTAEISGGTITAAGANSAGVYVVCGTVTISDDPEISGDVYGVYVDSGTAEISGGTITAISAYSCGVYASGFDSTVTVSGGTITALEEYGSGVYVEDGTANISGGTITATGVNGIGVYVFGGETNISGGTITATGANSVGIYVYDGGSVNVSGDPEVSGDSGVYVLNGTAEINGGTITATSAYSYGVFASGVDSTVTINGGTITATSIDSYGICVVDRSTVTISISANITISGGVYGLYNGDFKAFLADLPDPAAVTAGETKTVELAGVDATINFEVDNRYTDSELAASIDDSDKDIINLAPPDTMPAGTYTLVLYATSELNTFNLIIPVTVAAETTAPVLSAPAASDVTHTSANLNFTSGEAGTYYYLVYSASDAAPDRAAVKAQGTAVVKGTGAALAATNTVSVSGLAPSTAYKAYVVVEDAAGNISNVATIDITTTAAPPPDSGGGDNSGGGGGSGRSNPPSPVTNAPNKTAISIDAFNKTSGTTSDGKTVEYFTVQNTATRQIQQAKEEGDSSVEFNIASSRTSVTDITITSTVLESASGMNISVSTPHATLELPAALVNALAAAGQDLNLTVTRGEDMADPESGTVLGTTTEITTDIVGDTQVTIPLAGVRIPADPAERAAFLNSLAVFTYHSDGETELITGEIIYDASGNPVSISFPVDKFSTFAIVKLSQRTIALNIGSQAASLNGLNVALDAPAFINTQTNRTLVPLRFIGEALGAKVEWLPVARQVRITDGGQEILLTIDSQLVLKNGQSTRIDCALVVVPPGRTFLPLRFISEALGAEVVYDGAAKRIIITKEYGE